MVRAQGRREGGPRAALAFAALQLLAIAAVALGLPPFRGFVPTQAMVIAFTVVDLLLILGVAGWLMWLSVSKSVRPFMTASSDQRIAKGMERSSEPLRPHS